MWFLKLVAFLGLTAAVALTGLHQWAKFINSERAKPRTRGF